MKVKYFMKWAFKCRAHRQFWISLHQQSWSYDDYGHYFINSKTIRKTGTSSIYRILIIPILNFMWAYLSQK